MAKNVSGNMSKDMIDSIKNYGKEIQTLANFVMAVRKLPGMYIGSIGNKGFRNLIREIVQNSFDELNRDLSPCDKVAITFDERTQTTIVEDNGRGIPFGELERIFSQEHTSSHYEKKLYDYPSGLHGVGAKVTNALSSKFIVESFVLGEARMIEFDEGIPWKKGEIKIPNPDNKQGTRITFIPSIDAMGETSFTAEEVYNLINLIMPLNKIGAVVIFTGIDSKGKKYTEKLVNDDGILTYLIDSVKTPLVKPVHLMQDNGMNKVEVLFTYDVNVEMDNMNNSKLFAFCNTCPTTLGTHIDGTFDGICYFFTNYMNKIYLAKSTDTTNKKKKKSTSKSKNITVNFEDVKTGLSIVIAASHYDPQFDGQSKEKLSNEDIKMFAKNAMMDELDKWSKSNPSDLNKICKYLKDIAELRYKQDDEKVKISKKYNSSPTNGLPSNYVAPLGKTDLELWICEGESAAGAMQDKDNQRQGYFPIRGKIADAFSKSRSAFLSNEEVAGIIAIILDGISPKDYDMNNIGKVPIPVEKIKWSKIIFGTDADSDGDHISALLLRFFMLYMPELILAGRIYKSQPPLYGMVVPGKATGKYKRHKIKYFLDRSEYVEFIQKSFINKYKITTVDGTPISFKESAKFFYKNIDYTYELGKIADNHSMPSRLLEDILILRNEPLKGLIKKLKSKYRFIEVNQQGKTLVVSGSVDGAIRTVFFNDILLKECKKILDILETNDSYAYRINGELMGIYDIMSLFDKETPSQIQRYKGLGEMNGPKLFDSTLDPNNRVLIKYTIDSAKETIDNMRYYNNNMRELLNGLKVSRFDIMD